MLTSLPERRVERVTSQSALGRVLAETLTATSNVPPFHRASMDGFAVRAADTANAPNELELAGELRAGQARSEALWAGQAVAIMTGAPVPEGADAVQAVEQTRRSNDGRRVAILKPVRPGENIAPLGSEAGQGDIVIESGRVVGPADLAVMATFGYSTVSVWRRPSVALVTTGDELVEVEETPRPGQIRNSNAYSTGGQLRLMGIEVDYLGIARDDKADLCSRVSRGLERDVVILTGGVSMGEYDFVKDVFEELALELLFTKVAMKPGKPTVFARKGNKLAFGLPGNPVSAFVAFENFVRPALGRLCGFARPDLPRIQGALLRDMKQSPGRTAFLPARVWWEPDGWKIEPLRWHGSADIIGFSRANAAVIFPADRSLMRGGETAESILFADYLQRLQAN